MPVGDDPRMLNMFRAELHERATVRADRRLDERDFAAPHQAQVNAVDQPMHIPDDHAKAAARRHVGGNAEPDRGDREGHDDFQALPLAIAQPLSVTPRRQLDARRFADAHEVIALPTDQRDLLGGCGDSSLTRRASHGLDFLQSIIEWREIPATAARTDDPQPPSPFIERDSPSDPKARGASITVKCGVTERTTAEHARK